MNTYLTISTLGATAVYFNSQTHNSFLSGNVSTETAGLKTFSLGGNAGIATPVFSGTISDGSGQLALTKSQAGQWTLSSANTHTGATIMSAGTLILGHSLALQNSPLNTTSSIAGTSSAGLQTTVTTLTFGGLTGNKALNTLFNTGTSGKYNTVTALTLNPVIGATHTYDAAITDGATGMTLTKTGLGTQIITVGNSYTGATIISTGTLALGSTGSISNSPSITVGAGASFDVSAVTGGWTLGAAQTLAGSGTVTGPSKINGNVAPGVGGIGTLNTGAVTWNGGSNLFQFNLSSSNNTSDRLAITGVFTKGTAGAYTFDFMGSTPVYGQTYTLATFSSSDFVPGDFSRTGLGSGPYGTSFFTVNPTSLTFTAVPEASNLLVGGLLGLGLMSRRRKQA